MTLFNKRVKLSNLNAPQSGKSSSVVLHVCFIFIFKIKDLSALCIITCIDIRMCVLILCFEFRFCTHAEITMLIFQYHFFLWNMPTGEPPHKGNEPVYLPQYKVVWKKYNNILEKS